jgi:hypothetical protein
MSGVIDIKPKCTTFRGLPQSGREAPLVRSNGIGGWPVFSCPAKQDGTCSRHELIAERGIKLCNLQHGKPDQDAVIERFNWTNRTEALNAHLFESLAQVREIRARLVPSYHEERSLDALAGVPPALYRTHLGSQKFFITPVLLTGELTDPVRNCNNSSSNPPASVSMRHP